MQMQMQIPVCVKHDCIEPVCHVDFIACEESIPDVLSTQLPCVLDAQPHLSAAAPAGPAAAPPASALCHHVLAVCVSYRLQMLLAAHAAARSTQPHAELAAPPVTAHEAASWSSTQSQTRLAGAADPAVMLCPSFPWQQPAVDAAAQESQHVRLPLGPTWLLLLLRQKHAGHREQQRPPGVAVPASSRSTITLKLLL